MEPDLFKVETRRTRVRQAFASYKTDSVRLLERDLSGYTHLVASRHGIYAVHTGGFRLVAEGWFFGLVVRPECFYAFESCDQPNGPTAQGRIVRFDRKDDQITGARVTAKGLDNGCHAMDFIHGRLCVMDTYNQQILRFAEGEDTWETVHPLGRHEGRWLPQDLDYHHANTILAVGESIVLMLHNGAQHTGRNSELAVFDRDWNERKRVPLRGSGCHSLALLPTGRLLTCGSMEGALIRPDGFSLTVSPHMTRGLSVGQDSIVMGASHKAKREDRLTCGGNLIFMDRSYGILSTLDMPGAPMEIRRLDGLDASQSEYLATQPWGQSLSPEYLP